MILIGQYDSPFVRRVAIAMRLYGLGFEHRPWSTFGQGDEIAAFNPLRRVPTLVLDDGEALIESTAILDYLDEIAGADKAMIARTGPQRRQCLKICALATGLADKAVSLLYEPMFRANPSADWTARCRRQIADTFAVLEADLAARGTRYWLGPALSHPDVAFTCALRFTREAHPGLYDPTHHPTLEAHARACEALPAFAAIYQPITNVR